MPYKSNPLFLCASHTNNIADGPPPCGAKILSVPAKRGQQIVVLAASHLLGDEIAIRAKHVRDRVRVDSAVAIEHQIKGRFGEVECCRFHMQNLHIADLLGGFVGEGGGDLACAVINCHTGFELCGQ